MHGPRLRQQTGQSRKGSAGQAGKARVEAFSQIHALCDYQIPDVPPSKFYPCRWDIRIRIVAG